MDCVVPNDIPFQLLEEITDAFSKKRNIGSGSCGKVYKGVHKDGKKIAVKLLCGMPGLNDNELQNEFNHLKRLDHQNIVRLVGSCNETQKVSDLPGKRYKALCLEYMDKGSLDKYISDVKSGHSWSTRYKIIKGICEGLKYLHEESKPPIYHLDLKPANILLDENFSPKISDFGLSKWFGEEQTQIITNDRGTDEYSPPEYKTGGLVSMKFDIFSLGVVMMKIMVGRTGYCERYDFSSEQFIEHVQINWRNRLEERPDYIMDMEIYSQQIKTCIEIAVRCVEHDRNTRPKIGDIVNELNETEANVLVGMNMAIHKYLPPPVFPVHFKFVATVGTTLTLIRRKDFSWPADEFMGRRPHFTNWRKQAKLARELLTLLKLEMGLTDYPESPDMFFQQFKHVHRNERNRQAPAEDRRCRSGKTRHMNSSSASRYTLMRNWRY